MEKYLVEIKARSSNIAHQRKILEQHNAVSRGTDHQIDNYFVVPQGRLKLRQGIIENSLIYYQRTDSAGPKDSAVHLTKLSNHDQSISLAQTLTEALGVWVVVDKMREIWFADNVKIHLDQVVELGSFIEIEAIGDSAEEHEKLFFQCHHWMRLLSIQEEDLLTGSYSDMLS